MVVKKGRVRILLKMGRKNRGFGISGVNFLDEAEQDRDLIRNEL